MLERLLQRYGGLARHGFCTSQGSEEDLEGVTGREFTLFHHFGEGQR